MIKKVKTDQYQPPSPLNPITTPLPAQKGRASLTEFRTCIINIIHLQQRFPMSYLHILRMPCHGYTSVIIQIRAVTGVLGSPINRKLHPYLVSIRHYGVTPRQGLSTDKSLKVVGWIDKKEERGLVTYAERCRSSQLSKSFSVFFYVLSLS